MLGIKSIVANRMDKGTVFMALNFLVVKERMNL